MVSAFQRLVMEHIYPRRRAAALKDERVTAIAAKHGRTNAQILLRFLYQRGIPSIPKATSIERMKNNLDIFDFDLTAEEISFLSCVPQFGYSEEHPDYGMAD